MSEVASLISTENIVICGIKRTGDGKQDKSRKVSSVICIQKIQKNADGRVALPEARMSRT